MGQPITTTTMVETLTKLVCRAIEARERGDGRPFVIANFVTNRCPCKCRSCLWKHNDYEDVPLEDLKRFYTEAKELGFVATAFTGGEPFLRQDLGELTRFVKQELGLAVVVFTTGWFLQQRMDEVLPHIDMLVTSLDAASAEKHDRIRGLPGLFDRLMAGLKLAQERYPTISYQLNTCVQQGIEPEIDGLIALADELGIKISFDVITEHRNGGDRPSVTTDMGLALPELRQVCAGLLQRKAAGAPILNSERYFRYFADGRPGYRCQLPKMALFVDGRGYVEDCLNLHQPIASYRELALKDIMELPRFKQLRQDCEKCCSCSSPTMVDMSHVWETPQLFFQPGGISLG